MKLAASLDTAEVAKFQERILIDSSDRNARLVVLAASRAPMELRALQALWFIEHEPQTYLGPEPNIVTSLKHGDEAKSRWLAILAAHPDDIEVVDNAALYFMPLDPELGAKHLEAFRDRHPNSELGERLFTFWYSASIFHRNSTALFARRALEVAYQLFWSNDKASRAFSLLDRMQDCARCGGLTEAVAALQSARDLRSQWDYAASLQKRHLAFLVRGFVALAQGDRDLAEEELHQAVMVPVLPTESLVQLVAALLAKGSREVACLALERWRSRLLDHAEAVQAWTQDIEADSLTPPAVLRAQAVPAIEEE